MSGRWCLRRTTRLRGTPPAAAASPGQYGGGQPASLVHRACVRVEKRRHRDPQGRQERGRLAGRRPASVCAPRPVLGRPQLGRGVADYVAAANGEVTLMVQCETRQCYEDLEVRTAGRPAERGAAAAGVSCCGRWAWGCPPWDAPGLRPRPEGSPLGRSRHAMQVLTVPSRAAGLASAGPLLRRAAVTGGCTPLPGRRCCRCRGWTPALWGPWTCRTRWGWPSRWASPHALTPRSSRWAGQRRKRHLFRQCRLLPFHLASMSGMPAALRGPRPRLAGARCSRLPHLPSF